MGSQEGLKMQQTRPILLRARMISRQALLLCLFGGLLLIPFARDPERRPPKQVAARREEPPARLDFGTGELLQSASALAAVTSFASLSGNPEALPGEASAYASPSLLLLEEPIFVSPEPPPLEPAMLVGDEAPAFAAALAAYRAGDFAAGDAAAAPLRNEAAIAAAQWAGLRLHPREAGFKRLQRFLDERPDWPAAEWLRRQEEESLYAERASDAAVKSFFSEAKPLTSGGGFALARALVHEGEFEQAAALVRKIWRQNEFSESFESALLKEFGEVLAPADHKYRADRLLYAEKNAAALRAAALAGEGETILARVRMAANSNYGDDKLFAKVAPALQNDPGLLFARIHLARKREHIAEAGALMLKAPRDPALAIDGDAWWVERRLVARKLLDISDAKSAYEVCAAHAARSVSSKVEAEFHAGWIALRFLNDPALAEKHFDAIGAIAETPLQLSRANYWRARAAEARHTEEGDAEARELYAEAAAYSTTFYGQLAAAKLGAAVSPLREPPKAAEGDERALAVRVVELLLAAGEKESALTLAIESMKHLSGEAQIAALAEVAARPRDARISLNLGKLAANRGIALDDMAFPAYGVPNFNTLPGSASRSIVYAIARQESAFDPHAVSSAGAMGLMQMIASTARNTASRMRVGFDLHRMISEPAFNAQLGAAHLGILLGEHKGSYLLTFAAYNAGGGRVKEWIDAYGDPRKTNVDPIDWVERIPIQETRNYVQRVMENFVVYRAKFEDEATRAPQTDMARIGGQY